jgi:hypothetical protein
MLRVELVPSLRYPRGVRPGDQVGQELLNVGVGGVLLFRAVDGRVIEDSGDSGDAERDDVAVDCRRL